MDYTTDYLIQLVKEKETIPDSGAAFADDVLLRYLDQSLKAFIVPAIESTLEEHFVVTYDISIPAFEIAGTGSNPPVNVPNWFKIPSESTGLRLRDIYMVGNDGSFYNIPRLTPTQAAALGTNQGGAGAMNNTWFTGQNSLYGGFYLQGNTVQILPYGLASGKLFRLTYQRAPAQLCLVADAGQIVSVTGDVCTLDKVLPWYSGVTRVGVVSGQSPNSFVTDSSVPTVVYTSEAPLNNVLLTSVAGNVVVLPAGVGSNIQPGDWICPFGQSVYAQNIPRELMPVLVQKAAEMCIHAAGDSEGTSIANKSFLEMMKMAIAQIAPRVLGKPAKVLSTNSAFKASRANSLGRW